MNIQLQEKFKLISHIYYIWILTNHSRAFVQIHAYKALLFAKLAGQRLRYLVIIHFSVRIVEEITV